MGKKIEYERKSNLRRSFYRVSFLLRLILFCCEMSFILHKCVAIKTILWVSVIKSEKVFTSSLEIDALYKGHLMTWCRKSLILLLIIAKYSVSEKPQVNWKKIQCCGQIEFGHHIWNGMNALWRHVYSSLLHKDVYMHHMTPANNKSTQPWARRKWIQRFIYLIYLKRQIHKTEPVLSDFLLLCNDDDDHDKVMTTFLSVFGQ